MNAPPVRLELHAHRVTSTRVRVRARVVNDGPHAWRHTLPTSERVRIIATAAGERVFDSGADRFFLQVLTPIEVAPTGSLDLDEEEFDAPARESDVTARIPGTDLTASLRV